MACWSLEIFGDPIMEASFVMMNDDHLLHGSVIFETVTNTNFDSFRLLFK